MTDPLLAYRETDAITADPVGLVVVLYDTLLKDIREAVAALAAGDFDRRASAVRHTMLVLQQLQGTLDFENGGVVAQNLERFYNFTRAKLLEAQIKMSAEMFEQQITFVASIREAWQQVRKEHFAQQPPVAADQLESAAAPAALLTASEAGVSHWRA